MIVTVTYPKAIEMTVAKSVRGHPCRIVRIIVDCTQKHKINKVVVSIIIITPAHDEQLLNDKIHIPW